MLVNMRLVVLLIIAYVHSTTQFELVGKNVEEHDQFGFSVAVWGNTVAVGAPSDDSNSTEINGDSSNNDLTDSRRCVHLYKEW
jgi:hypothetical protein